LDMGRRPMLKSEEIFGVPIQIIELKSLLCLKPLKEVVQLLGILPNTRPDRGTTITQDTLRRRVVLWASCPTQDRARRGGGKAKHVKL